MFEGYFGRRRLKIIIISISLSLLLLLIIDHRKTVKRVHRIRSVPIATKLTTESISSIILQTPVVNILSSIKFTNSPYLNVHSHSSKTIPILVLSKSSHVEVRDAIRRTWALYRFNANKTIDIRVFFLVGIDDYTSYRVRAEQMLFNDVIHVSIPDLNSFIAYKELSAMIWIRSYLPEALVYIKTEEEAIFNTQAVVRKLLPIIQNVRNENLIIGWFGSKHLIQRAKHQQFINAVIAASNMNLSYAMSLLYIVTSKACDRMLDALSNTNLIELPGDPFVTGLLRQVAGVQIHNLASDTKNYRYELTNGDCPEALANNSNLLVCTSSLHFGSEYSMSEYFDAWNRLDSIEL